MRKAFDRMWRNGLFSKLIDKVEKPMWRAIYNYYKYSKAKVKLDNQLSEEFDIKEGVKQGGILSPYLFNFFMNELLEESDRLNQGAAIGNLNISLISYCDDLIILSPLVKHVNRILNLCSEYAGKWKLIFNTNKCNWYVHGNFQVSNPKFTLNQIPLKQVDNLIHLGLPIGNQKHVEEFFCENFKKVERSFYSLYSLGCNNYGLNFHIIASIYKKFSQSIFYYGLETNYIRKQCLNNINIRQNTLLKNTFGISKFSRSKCLLNVLKIKSINQLYEEYKILFIKQLRRNNLTKQIFEALQVVYNVPSKIPRESYFSIINSICNKYDIIIDINMNHKMLKENINIINENYIGQKETILNELRRIIQKTGSPSYDTQTRMQFKLLLTVNFN